jgi:hypothetical protein
LILRKIDGVAKSLEHLHHCQAGGGKKLIAQAGNEKRDALAHCVLIVAVKI